MTTHTVRFKVVVAGPFAAGKTTFIQQISDVPVVGTEASTSGEEATVKATTTVGMEYGAYSLEDDGVSVELHLYGVPGQARFRFMWDIVSQGMDALLLLVDASEPASWDDARTVHEHFQDHPVPPTVIAVNNAKDLPHAIQRIQAAIPDPAAAYRPCDVTDAGSTRAALVTLLTMLLSRLESQEPM